MSAAAGSGAAASAAAVPSLRQPHLNVPDFILNFWEQHILQGPNSLFELIKIPHLSIDFDPAIRTNGHEDRAFAHIQAFVEQHKPTGAVLTLHKVENRSPLLHIDIAPSSAEIKSNVLLYGHADRQPEMLPWSEGLGPFQPVFREEPMWKQPALYGRGSSDDLYSVYAAICAINHLQSQSKPHGRIQMIVEGAEESDSDDLEYWLNALKSTIGRPEVTVVLDSGAADDKRLYLTNSLRGCGSCVLEVEIADGDQHSGLAGGITPDPLRIVRMLLERVENTQTGEVLLPQLRVDIPAEVLASLEPFSAVNCEEWLKTNYKFIAGAAPTSNSVRDNLIDGTWRSSITITGIDFLPAVADGGNLIRGKARVKLSVRLPPMVDHNVAAAAFKAEMERDPPYGARVTARCDEWCPGFYGKIDSPWLLGALETASKTTFGATQNFVGMGCGGSIPFCETLQNAFGSELVVTGVLVPNSNAHAKDEMLLLPYAAAVTNCVSVMLEAHGQHGVQQGAAAAGKK